MKMKRFFIAGLLFCYSVLLSADWQTVSTTTVGPGVVHIHLVESTEPWNMNILEMDLTNPNLAIESVKAKDALYGYEGTSSMAARSSFTGHRVVGALNADFFGDGGVPVNAQIIKGELLKTPYHYSTIGFDWRDSPFIGLISFTGFVETHNQSHSINGVNQERNTDQLILFNSYQSTSTGTNQWGKELLIAPLEGWMVNDTLRYVIEKIENYTGNMSIPKGKAVLSAHGTAIDFFANSQVGDTVTLALTLKPNENKLQELVGGFPQIVKNGSNYALQGYAEEGGNSSFATAYHPRTAIGYNADKTKLFFFAMDGRQDGLSRGMSLPELADFMIARGVYQGLNLDGGGSTTIVVNGSIRNSPSDGHERAVSNALLVVSSAAEGSLHEVQIEPDKQILFRGDDVQFTASGWDANYNPKSLHGDSILFVVDSSLGMVSTEGHFTATQNGGDGYVYLHYGAFSDSAHIHIRGVRQIDLEPDSCVTDSLHTVQFTIKATEDNGMPITLEGSNYAWQVSDTTIGTIDANGLFTPLRSGKTLVVVSYAELKDTAQVSVEMYSGQSLLDSIETLQGWRISSENMDTLLTTLDITDSLHTIGQKALRIEYHFKRLSTDYSTVHLDTDIPVLGMPEFIDFDFKSDGKNHKAYVVVSDENGVYFKSAISGYANDSTQWDTLSAKTRSFRPLDEGTLYYPVRIKSLWIRLGSTSAYGEENSGVLYVDNLRVRYPEVTAVFPMNRNKLPGQTRLFPNYPNPFNPQTTISFFAAQSGPVQVDIFNMLGQKIDTLLHKRLSPGLYELKWNAAQKASGLYVCRLQSGRETRFRKMLLIK